MDTLFRLIGGLILLASNAFFVTTEFALTRVRQFEEEDFADGGSLELAWRMTDQLELYLTGCQLGITISSVGLGITAEPAVSAVIYWALGTVLPAVSSHALSMTISVILINLAHIILGEQVPTYLGIEKSKGILRLCATLHYYWTMIMYPVIYMGDKVAKGLLGLVGIRISRSWTGETEEEAGFGQIVQEMGDVLSKGKIPEDRQEEVMRALEIGSIPVEEIMVPRDNITFLSTSRSTEKNIRTVETSPYTRYPLIGASPEEFIGIIYAPSLFSRLESLENHEVDFEDLAESPMVVDRQTPVARVIDLFQDRNQELALVMEDHSVIGLVTTTDAVEVIIGDLKDPLDGESETETRVGGNPEA